MKAGYTFSEEELNDHIWKIWKNGLKWGLFIGAACTIVLLNGIYVGAKYL